MELGPGWRDGYKWTGHVDAAGLPQGHGVVACRADSYTEEGGMVAGKRQGRWIQKQNGAWRSWQYEDGAYQSCQVHLGPALGGRPRWRACDVRCVCRGVYRARRRPASRARRGPRRERARPAGRRRTARPGGGPRPG